MERVAFNSLFAIMTATIMNVFISSCGSDDSSLDIADSQSKFSYTIGSKTYNESKYWPSSIFRTDIDDDGYEVYWMDHGRRYYWEINICGAIDDAIDGNWLFFHIFTQDVGNGFELTKDNFIAPYWPFGDLSSETFDFKKKSGSAKITEFDAHSAKMVFNNFIMEADGATFNITVNGTVDLDVD